MRKQSEVLSRMMYLPYFVSQGFKFKLVRTDAGSSFDISPASKLTPKLREQLRSCRDILLAELHLFESYADERAAMWLAVRGWVAVRSAALGQLVVWVRDDSVQVPARYANAPVYTLEELRLLQDCCAGPEHLQLIHEVRGLLGGRVTTDAVQYKLQEVAT
jgi:hypothetical protein